MFEHFVDLVHARLAADPAMHVYHYGTYENAALKQLMGTYATREEDGDELLRRGSVRQSAHHRASRAARRGRKLFTQGSRSARAIRAARRRPAAASGRARVRAMDEPHDEALLKSIAEYNDDDCRATLALRDWLVEQHPDDLPWAQPS